MGNPVALFSGIFRFLSVCCVFCVASGSAYLFPPLRINNTNKLFKKSAAFSAVSFYAIFGVVLRGAAVQALRWFGFPFFSEYVF